MYSCRQECIPVDRNGQECIPLYRNTFLSTGMGRNAFLPTGSHSCRQHVVGVKGVKHPVDRNGSPFRPTGMGNGQGQQEWIAVDRNVFLSAEYIPDGRNSPENFRVGLPGGAAGAMDMSM